MNENTSQSNSQLTPEAFKQSVMSSNPSFANATASDGTPYSKMDATDFTQRLVKKFPDGVTKDGHKYSDFLPKSPEVAPQPQESTLSKIGHGVLDFGKGLLKPVIGTLAIPTQLLAKAVGAPDPFANGAFPTPFGKTDVTPLNVKQKLGDIAQTAAYALPGEGILGAAGFGALQGAGSSLSNNEDVGKAAVSGGIGALAGGALGGAAKLVGKGVEAIGNNISGKAQKDAIEGIRNAYSDALNLSAGQRAVENRTGKDLAQTLMKNEVPLGRYEDGTLDASQAIETLKSKLAPLDAESQAILGGTKAKINLFDAANEAKSAINAKNLPSLDKSAIVSNIDKHVQAEVMNRANTIAQDTYGTTLDKLTQQQKSKVIFDAANPHVTEADKIKSSFWNSIGKGFDRDTQLGENATYQMGNSIKTAIEDALPNERVGALNKERGEMIDAIRRLTKLDGVKKVKGGVGKAASGIIGALAGSASGTGPIGTLAGDYFGQKAAEFLANPANKIAIAKGKAKAAGLIPTLLGKAAKPVGETISTAGKTVRKSARAAGLAGDVAAKNISNNF